jgi:hypothetical protein
MTPDVFTTFELVNAANENLVVVTTPVPPINTAWNAYQMAQWFGFPSMPSPLCAATKAATYTGQFLRGEGDENDAADLLVGVDSSQVDSTLFALQARTHSDSGHYMQIVPVVGSGIQRYLIGLVLNGTFEQEGPTGVQWYALSASTLNPLSLGPACSNSTQAIVVVSLDDLYYGDPARAQELYAAAETGPLSAAQLDDLYQGVSARCFPEA